MAENTPEDGQKFSQLVEGLVSLAQSKTKCKNSDILRDVIKFHIRTWLDQVENVNPLYKVSELIPVGSYAEGTKILQPDEFDYLVVIEEFSKPNMIEIDADESDIQKALVKVFVVDEDLKSECSGLCKDGHLKCFQPITFPKRQEKRFGHILIEALWMIVKRSERIDQTSGSPSEIECRILLPTVNNVSLYFNGAEFRAPNVLIKFEYETMEVTVDISPAIRYHKIYDCFRENDCAGPAFAELVLSHKSLLLVGTSTESDFKLTVTEAEVEYIQTVMKAEHKIIYIFLKYIVKLFNDFGGNPFPFTSYMMKTICIHHDMKCEINERSIKECYKSVIDDLNACQQQEFVVSIVNRHIRLYPRYKGRFFLECLPSGMRRMCRIAKDINTLEAFNSFLKRIVREEHHKRSKAEEIRLINIIEAPTESAQDERNEEDLEAMNGQRQKLNQEGSSATSQEIPVSGKCSTYCKSEGPSNTSTACSFQGQDSHSEQCPLELNCSQNTTTNEILYQRGKHS